MKKYIVSGLVLVFLIYIFWSNTSIELSKIDIYDNQIPESFSNFKILHVSDLHNRKFGRNNNKLINLMQKTKSDIIVITGDLIDTKTTDLINAREFIENIVDIAPVFYVTGNHEARSEIYKDLEQMLMALKVNVLKDKAVYLNIKNEFILVAGIDDPEFSKQTYNVFQIPEKLNEEIREFNGFKILLSHRPELIDLYTGSNINLVFCGHAHGGQVRIPFLGGLISPDQGIFPEYSGGCYEINATKMVVSRGLGNSIVPVRINNRPHLILVTLK